MVVVVDRLKVHKCTSCPNMLTSHQALEKSKHDYYNDLFNAHMLSAYILLENVKIFECDTCGHCFQSKRDYMLHKVKHIKNTVNLARNSYNNRLIAKPYKCSECALKFAAESTLEAHSAVHRPLPHICDCGIGYYTQKDLNSHRNLVHIHKAHLSKSKKKLPWKPKIELVTVKENIPNFAAPNIRGPKLKAKLLFKSVPTIRTTYLKGEAKIRRDPRKILTDKTNVDIKKIAKNKFECPMCKKVLNSKGSVIIHLRVHTGEKPYECAYCTKRFSQPGALKIHLTTHTGNKDFACKYCEKRFGSRGALSRHTRTHTGEKPHKCSFCEKTFGDKSAHGRHERTHTGDKRYRCIYCPMAFTDASGLIVHRNRHENNKKIQCDTCNKKFFDKRSLHRHIKIHEPDENKPYCCDYCKRRFHKKEYLEQHIKRIHLEVKKYNCEHCSKCFYHRISMINHVQAKHRHDNLEY